MVFVAVLNLKVEGIPENGICWRVKRYTGSYNGEQYLFYVCILLTHLEIKLRVMVGTQRSRMRKYTLETGLNCWRCC